MEIDWFRAPAQAGFFEEPIPMTNSQRQSMARAAFSTGLGNKGDQRVHPLKRFTQRDRRLQSRPHPPRRYGHSEDYFLGRRFVTSHLMQSGLSKKIN